MDYTNFYKHTAINDIVRQLANTLGTGERKILDLGAGEGTHAKYLAHKGFYVVAVDNNKRTIDKLALLSKRTTKIKPCFADITHPKELPEDAYDAILCTYVLHQLSHTQINKIAEYIKEHIKPRGFFAITAYLGKFKTLFDIIEKEFSGWTTIRQQLRRTGSFQVPNESSNNLVERLLQKPNGQS